MYAYFEYDNLCYDVNKYKPCILPLLLPHCFAAYTPQTSLSNSYTTGNFQKRPGGRRKFVFRNRLRACKHGYRIPLRVSTLASQQRKTSPNIFGLRKEDRGECFCEGWGLSRVGVLVSISIYQYNQLHNKVLLYICFMKTNVILQSKDRELFGVTIRTETKTGFLSISDLQEAYTQARVKNGWSAKGEIQHILSQKENSERLYYILSEQGIINCDFSQFMEECDKDGTIKTLKKFGAYKTTGARKNKTTWCNPYVWTLAAMELNPMLYGKVVTWLTDKLILNRIEAGVFYVELSKALGKFIKPDYPTIAKALNYIVFGRHETGIRNTGTESQLKELKDLEAKFAWAINMGYITSQEQLIGELRKICKDKYPEKKWLS